MLDLVPGCGQLSGGLGAVLAIKQFGLGEGSCILPKHFLPNKLLEVRMYGGGLKAICA